MRIQWRDSLAIGVVEIDNQHKELLKRFGLLLEACESGKGKEELAGLLTFLDEYVLRHFADEEELQRQKRYPAYVAHKQQHDSFIASLKALKSEIDQDGMALHHVMETNNMLLKWLINHISKVDIELGRFLKGGSTQA